MSELAPFPREESEFAADPRVALSKEKNNYILEDENGTEWEWVSSRNTWTETVSTSKQRSRLRFCLLFSSGDRLLTYLERTGSGRAHAAMVRSVQGSRS
jgi:hypothetical protein